MNLAHLTTDEILRTASPETSLERVLFGRIESALDEAQEARNETRETILDYESYECPSCTNAENEIEGLEEKIKALRALLDERDIKHDHI